jgi:hypothetical protein
MKNPVLIVEALRKAALFYDSHPKVSFKIALFFDTGALDGPAFAEFQDGDETERQFFEKLNQIAIGAKIDTLSVFYTDKGKLMIVDICDKYQSASYYVDGKLHETPMPTYFDEVCGWFRNGCNGKPEYEDLFNQRRKKLKIRSKQDIDLTSLFLSPRIHMDDLDDPSVNERERQIRLARRKISDDLLVEFFRFVRGNDRLICTSIINKELDKGNSLDTIFYTGDKFGYHLSVKAISDSLLEISFGCVAGPMAGDGGLWKVLYAGDKVVSVKYVSGWIS